LVAVHLAVGAPPSEAEQGGEVRALEATAVESSTEVEPANDDPPAPENTAMYTISAGSDRDGPPFYDAADEAKLRARHGIATGQKPPQTVRWRCLIADPSCGVSFEVNVTSAYAYRVEQGDVRVPDGRRWSSGRIQYDFWFNLPVLTEYRDRKRITRMTLAPKGGVIFSDQAALWGDLGLALRYWFTQGRWAPTLEVSSALTFKLGEQVRSASGDKRRFEMTRGPVGVTLDVGVGIGGFGAIVVGGQYDSPLARDDVPEQFHVSAAGMFFVGFRGNIVWGGPAAAGVVTHVVTQRTVGR
jgi:hypothetical protein